MQIKNIPVLWQCEAVQRWAGINKLVSDICYILYQTVLLIFYIQNKFL